MAFFQMDDKFHSELRVMQAGTAAFGLYSRCGDWVADHLMDGFVPAEVAANFGTREWIERLLASGLWLPADGGYTMPDYLGRHGNWSKEKVLAHRAAAAERQARARGRRAGHQDDDMSQSESRVTHTASNGVSHSSPSHPHPIALPSEENPAAQAPPDTDKPARKRSPKRPAAAAVAARFEDFWKVYPRRQDIGPAEKAWTKAINDLGADPQDVIDAAIEYAMKRKGQDPAWTKLPATWLNARSWLNEPDPVYKPAVIGAPSEAATAMPRPYADVLAEQAAYGAEQGPWTEPPF